MLYNGLTAIPKDGGIEFQCSSCLTEAVDVAGATREKAEAFALMCPKCGRRLASWLTATDREAQLREFASRHLLTPV